MVQAWLMDSSEDDQRLLHKKSPSIDVTLKELADLGVLHWKLNADSPDDDPELKRIREDRGYNYSDVITCTPEKLPNYEQKLKNFFVEHLHSDEEIRYILDGSGYFDVRNKSEEWIRISLEKGDMIALPAGIYHRFTLNDKNYIKVMRLFSGEPVWTPINRPADDHPARLSYITDFVK